MDEKIYKAYHDVDNALDISYATISTLSIE